MGATPVHFSSLDRVAERVVEHLRRERNTVVAGSPGCGITTFVSQLAAAVAGGGFRVNRFDAKVKKVSVLAAELAAERPAGVPQQVVILDHVASLPDGDFTSLLTALSQASEKNRDLCLWCGPVDARRTEREHHVKLCTVPSAHLSFPVLTRDELLTAYRHIGAAEGCHWGDSILYLMLDLCGTDLSLVASLTAYLPGDWNDRLYDSTVWDCVQTWLRDPDNEVVEGYRVRLRGLRDKCEPAIQLVRFGGKPQCLRSELIEESKDELRALCFGGFLIPNLLPGFYQLRNIVVRLLLDGATRPESLLRRSLNERAGALLQDAESMLRQILAYVFVTVGAEAAKSQLKKIQQPGEIIEEKLNAGILKWSRETLQDDLHKKLTGIITEHRNSFKLANTVWATTEKMMLADSIEIGDSQHLHAIAYLTFDQLGTLVIGLLDQALPHITKESEKKRIRDGWQEGVAKIRRLRNQVAHLRNVSFQDMEDLTKTLTQMRQDVLLYGGWQTRPASALRPAMAPATAAPQTPVTLPSSVSAPAPALEIPAPGPAPEVLRPAPAPSTGDAAQLTPQQAG